MLRSISSQLYTYSEESPKRDLLLADWLMPAGNRAPGSLPGPGTGPAPAVSVERLPGLLPGGSSSSSRDSLPYQEVAVGLANRPNGPGAVSVGQRVVHWPIMQYMQGADAAVAAGK